MRVLRVHQPYTAATMRRFPIGFEAMNDGKRVQSGMRISRTSTARKDCKSVLLADAASGGYRDFQSFDVTCDGLTHAWWRCNKTA